MEKGELKIYYEKYLKETKELSERTVGHYCDALNTISRLLIDDNKIESSIYDIESVDELKDLINHVSKNQEYIGLNKRGNNMYSAGLNHFYKFVSGEKFRDLSSKIDILDIPVKKNKSKIVISKLADRSSIIRNQIIEASGHKCEYDNSHISFIQEKNKQQYVEAHHIIPLKYQDKFENSLDVYANVISLCPNCHRRIHYGLNSDVKTMLYKIYTERVTRYKNSGINISINDVCELILK